MRSAVMLMLAAALGAACAAPTSPSIDPRIDVLDFIIGDANLWPRQGSQWQHQQVDFERREVCWTKYGNARMFECWRWDDQWIYHRVDHGLDGNTGESYEFSDGRWMPRYFSGAWTLDVADNRIRWFDSRCQLDEARSGAFPYQQRVSFEAGQVISPELGVRDLLLLEYAPGPAGGRTYFETFRFARGAGWYSWQNSNGASVRFDRFGGPVRTRAAFCGEGTQP